MAYSAHRAFPAPFASASSAGQGRAGARVQQSWSLGYPAAASTPAPQASGEADLDRAPASMQSLDVIDIESELGYWRSHYRGLTHCEGLRYSDHEPALKLGLDAYMRGHGRSIDEMEQELRDGYRRTRGGSRLDWDQARGVVEAAWHRLNNRGGAG